MLEKLSRRVVFGRLHQLAEGSVNVVDNGQTFAFGTPGSELQATIHVPAGRFYRRVAFGGGLGAAESFMDGDWHCDDLASLLRVMIRNLAVSDRFDRGPARLSRYLAKALDSWRRNTRRGAARNIRSHYDLGNEFYSLFLDDTLTYSCAIFEHPQAALREASLAKLDRVCRRLALQPTDHLLEIGTGWGALAIHAAQRFGCRVTSTTISLEQYRYAIEGVREAGLEDQVTILNTDYRDLQGEFDKLVSIEMVEAVGHQYFDTFFRKCSELLASDGMMLLQAIVMNDQRYREYIRSVDFIRRYIFPGGCLPSVAAILDCTSRMTDMRLLHLEDFAPHYAETLRRWRSAFHQKLDDVRSMGFTDRFIRMWDYYLAYCEAGFEERQVSIVQMLTAKPANRSDNLHQRRTVLGAVTSTRAEKQSAAATREDRDNSGVTHRQDEVGLKTSELQP